MVNSAFGFAYKYASKPNGESYTLPADPNTDNRFDSEQEVINNGDGTYRFTDDNSVDFSILTSALFNEDNIIDDHSDLDPDSGGRGYMMDLKDWRDVEIDFMWKVDDYTNEDGWYLHVGGGRHANPQPFCEGASYVFKMFYNGDIQFLKEQWHNFKVPVENEDDYLHYVAGVNYAGDGIIEQFENLRGLWCTCKFVRYNVKQNDGSTAVKLEFYANISGDKQTWELVTDVLDTAGWGADGEECGGNADQVINWGFPMVRFYWKNADRIDWYGLTIREIQPTGAVPPPGDGGGGGDGGEPPPPYVPPPEQPTGKVSRIGSFRFSIASTLATSCDGVEPAEPPSDPNPPPDGGTDPPPPAGGVLSFYLAEYFQVGS